MATWRLLLHGADWTQSRALLTVTALVSDRAFWSIIAWVVNNSDRRFTYTAAAHVCGLISLILSDDDCVVTQADLKSALINRFTETTEVKSEGKVPIRVLKKFMQPFHNESKPQHDASRDVSAEARVAASLRIQRLVRPLLISPISISIEFSSC